VPKPHKRLRAENSKNLIKPSKQSEVLMIICNEVLQHSGTLMWNLIILKQMHSPKREKFIIIEDAECPLKFNNKTNFYAIIIIHVICLQQVGSCRQLIPTTEIL
jgi:hypothetical protein